MPSRVEKYVAFSLKAGLKGCLIGAMKLQPEDVLQFASVYFSELVKFQQEKTDHTIYQVIKEFNRTKVKTLPASFPEMKVAVSDEVSTHHSNVSTKCHSKNFSKTKIIHSSLPSLKKKTNKAEPRSVQHEGISPKVIRETLNYSYNNISVPRYASNMTLKETSSSTGSLSKLPIVISAAAQVPSSQSGRASSTSVFGNTTEQNFSSETSLKTLPNTTTFATQFPSETCLQAAKVSLPTSKKKSKQATPESALPERTEKSALTQKEIKTDSEEVKQFTTDHHQKSSDTFEIPVKKTASRAGNDLSRSSTEQSTAGMPAVPRGNDAKKKPVQHRLERTEYSVVP